MNTIELLQDELRKQLPNLELRENEPMRKHTTFRVGGPAALMAFPHTEEELSVMIRTAHAMKVAPFYLGKGSNLLVTDERQEIFVICMAGALTQLTLEEDHVIYAGSGVSMAQMANFALDHELSGAEFAHGIPGSLGGGVYMNAGAYGGEMSQIIQSVDYLDETGARHTLPADQLDLRYRHSVFSEKDWLILGARLKLHPGKAEDIRAVMADYSERRRSKQPLEFASAGSTFKRPEGYFAGALIEGAGLKGTSVGDAQVSEKHAGFVINRGNATCSDILNLIQIVRERVLKKDGVLLEPEVRMMGITLENPVIEEE